MGLFKRRILEVENGAFTPAGAEELVAGAAAATVRQRPVDYKQGASKWGKKMYSSTGNRGQTMSNSGCGPTAMADVIATLVDPSVTPWTVAQEFVKRGYRTANAGTSSGAFKFAARYWDFQKYGATKSVATLRKALDMGALCVANMGKGYWTKNGHYICVWKVDNGLVYACDPASRTRKKQPLDDFKRECKGMHLFLPKGGA